MEVNKPARGGGGSAVVTPPAGAIVMPNTTWRPADPGAYGGQPASIDHLRELEFADKSDNARWAALDVVPTTADLILDYIRANSLWPLLSGLACCAMEMMSAATSVNDMDRFNMFPFRASPRQADVLIVAGTLTTKMAGPLVRLWEQMPEPKWCVAMGDCTCSGGRYKRSYATVEGIDRVLPVDVYVPGCPPRPEGLIYGMLKLQQLVLERRGHWPERKVGPTVPAGVQVAGPRVRFTDRAVLHRLDDLFGEHLLVPAVAVADTIELVIAAGSVPAVLRGLRDDGSLRYEILSDICGVDTGETMQVVYHLWSPLSPDWVRVIADGLSRDDPRVPSITFLWPGAEWGEREAYDMFGIVFEGNRDLRRIYMPPDYLAFPLRKDFLLADDASRAPGEGIRPMELAFQPAEQRSRPVRRHSPGAGAVLGADGQRLRLPDGRPAIASGAVPGKEVAP